MRNRLLIFLGVFSLISTVSIAQMVGTDCFLQGHWVEVGVNQMGGFGTCTSPATYHAHTSGMTPTPGNAMDAVYDYGHDGWSVGVPSLAGSYTIPGYPQEGWSVQVGATEYRNGGWGGTCTGAFAVPGSITSYSNAGGSIRCNFTGNVAGLHIVSETRVDTESSAAVVTVTFYNTTAAPIAGIYYERTCDPDNTTFFSSGTSYGGPTTHNVIVHQNEDARHEVLVSSVGLFPSTTYAYWSYMALGTKDCRAKCFILSGSSGGLAPGATPSTFWSGGTTCISTLHDSITADCGISLIYNLGTLAASGTPGDSAIISYAYFYNQDNGIDSAFPDPTLVINGAPVTTLDDTLNACAYPGVDSISVDILHGDDKDWSWSKWSWSPALGLSTTAGVHNFVNLNALSSDITYTVTGSDSSGGTMVSCNNRVLIFTVHPCHDAWCNSPCVGDALTFRDKGDSIGATYFWYGPGGFSSTLHDPNIVPATFADDGMYYVVRTIGSVHDTDSCYAYVHPLPTLNLTSDQGLCAKIQDSVWIAAAPDSAGEQFAWVGPAGFTSTLEIPVIHPFDTTHAGTYTVHATSQYGCKSTASINIFPGPVPDFDFRLQRGCTYDTVNFIDLSQDADSYWWNFGDGVSGITARDPGLHIYFGHDAFNVTLICTNSFCVDSIMKTVNLQHSVTAGFGASPDTICFAPGGSLITFANVSTATSGSSPYSTTTSPYLPVANEWSFGDGGSSGTAGPSHTYMAPGQYIVKLVVTDSIPCKDSITHPVYVVQLGITAFGDTTLCISQPFPLTNVITSIPNIDLAYTYNWTPSTNLDDPTAHTPYYSGLGLNTFTETVTTAGTTYTCTATTNITVNSVMGKMLANVTASDTILYGSSIQLNADSEVYYLWKPNDGSLNNNNINDPIATPMETTTYTVYGFDVNGCLDSAYVTVYVNTETTEGVPSAFTPNHDGLNDVLKPIGPKFYRMLEFRVFNRYGEEVFYSNNKDHGWDGTYHDVPQDIGTYFYQIIVAVPGGQNITYKGDVLLIR